MLKEEYNKIDFEIIAFEAVDVIVTSDGGDEVGGGDPIGGNN